MADTPYDGYRTAGDHGNAAIDWFLNLIATYGIGPVLAVELAIVIGFVWACWTLADRHEQRMQRKSCIDQVERYANHPANRTRKEDRP